MTGRKSLPAQRLEELLQRLIEWDALEICRDAENREILIPYVMNDAVEYYLCLTEASMHGELDGETEKDTSVELVQNDNVYGLIFRQSSGNTVSIWYGAAYENIHCYQYHLIGHAWRREKGEEYIRRLVNLICVLHDKKTYLGSVYCAETESLIADLAEFAPVLYFTPINESLLEWYPESLDGIEAAGKLAGDAEDTRLQKEIIQYANLFRKGKIGQKQIQRMAGLLLQREHTGFWRCLDEKIRQASARLPVRDYGAEAEKHVEGVRRRIVAGYRKKGFQGEYPCLSHRTADGKSDRELVFVEEQPFSVLESHDFKYRIFSLNIDPEHVADCEWREEMAWKWR